MHHQHACCSALQHAPHSRARQPAGMSCPRGHRACGARTNVCARVHRMLPTPKAASSSPSSQQTHPCTFLRLHPSLDTRPCRPSPSRHPRVKPQAVVQAPSQPGTVAGVDATNASSSSPSPLGTKQGFRRSFMTDCGIVSRTSLARKLRLETSTDPRPWTRRVAGAPQSWRFTARPQRQPAACGPRARRSCPG